MGNNGFQNKNKQGTHFQSRLQYIQMYLLKKSQEGKCNRNGHRNRRTIPAGATPTSRTTSPRPYLSSDDHDHLGSHVATTVSRGKNFNVWQHPEMTLPEYRPVTLLVVMLQRRTGSSDLETLLRGTSSRSSRSTLKTGEESFYFFSSIFPR